MDRMISVKNDTLKFVREYYEVSIQEVALRTKIKEETITAFEDGEEYPSYAQLEKLANYYNRPLFLFFTNYISHENSTEIAFRSIRNSTNNELSKKTKEMIEKANGYRMNLEELYQNDERISFCELISDEHCTSAKELINLLRGKLELSLDKQKVFGQTDKLLEYVREKLYNIGIYVFKDSFKDNEVAGLCLYDDKYPIVLLNNKATFNRQLFTVFHELFHIFCRKTDVDFISRNEEAECNKFASDFLIPQSDLDLQIMDIDDLEDREVIKHLARLYNVSEDAIMYRLYKMQLISSSFYNDNKISAFRESNSASAGGNFYFTRISYLGNPYLHKVFSLYYAGKVTKSQVGMYTQLKPVHVAKLASSLFGGAF